MNALLMYLHGAKDGTNAGKKSGSGVSLRQQKADCEAALTSQRNYDCDRQAGGSLVLCGKVRGSSRQCPAFPFCFLCRCKTQQGALEGRAFGSHKSLGFLTV